MRDVPWDSILQIAEALGIESKDARRKWRERGHIPHRHRYPILREAMRQGIPLTATDVGLEAA